MIKPCDIVGKGDVVVSLSNGSILKLRNVRHVSKLKRNLISIEQLAGGGMKTTFDGDVLQDHQRCHGDGLQEEGRYFFHYVRFQGHQFQLLRRKQMSGYGIRDMHI